MLRIGTRKSPLALWQANAVADGLRELDYDSTCINIDSSGDIDLVQPLYEMGITGVFTKELDIALLNDQIDCAVHSLKDVPTKLPKGLELVAVLERGAHEDLLIKKATFRPDQAMGIATSSIRRKSQWLAKYPNHFTVNIRGNVQTRMKKFLADDQMQAIIFAKAGLERMNMIPEQAETIDWMIPAPSQGIVGVVCRSNDIETIQKLQAINHAESFKMATVERQFMSTLQGGCSVPIACLSTIEQGQISLKGSMHALDGTKYYTVNLSCPLEDYENLGARAAEALLSQDGAPELLEIIRN